MEKKKFIKKKKFPDDHLAQYGVSLCTHEALFPHANQKAFIDTGWFKIQVGGSVQTLNHH